MSNTIKFYPSHPFRHKGGLYEIPCRDFNETMKVYESKFKELIKNFNAQKSQLQFRLSGCPKGYARFNHYTLESNIPTTVTTVANLFEKVMVKHAFHDYQIGFILYSVEGPSKYYFEFVTGVYCGKCSLDRISIQDHKQLNTQDAPGLVQTLNEVHHDFLVSRELNQFKIGRVFVDSIISGEGEFVVELLDSRALNPFDGGEREFTAELQGAHSLDGLLTALSIDINYLNAQFERNIVELPPSADFPLFPGLLQIIKHTPSDYYIQISINHLSQTFYNQINSQNLRSIDYKEPSYWPPTEHPDGLCNAQFLEINKISRELFSFKTRNAKDALANAHLSFKSQIVRSSAARKIQPQLPEPYKSAYEFIVFYNTFWQLEDDWQSEALVQNDVLYISKDSEDSGSLYYLVGTAPYALSLSEVQSGNGIIIVKKIDCDTEEEILTATIDYIGVLRKSNAPKIRIPAYKSAPTDVCTTFVPDSSKVQFRHASHSLFHTIRKE